MKISVRKDFWRPPGPLWGTVGRAGEQGCIRVRFWPLWAWTWILPSLFPLQRQAATQPSCTPAEHCPLVSLQLLPTTGQKNCPGFVSHCLMAASISLQGVDSERHRLWHQHGARGCPARYLRDTRALTQPAMPAAKGLLASACNALSPFPGSLSLQVSPSLCWWMSPLVTDSTQHFSLFWSILSLAHLDISQWVSSGTPPTLLAGEEVHAAPAGL